MIVIGPNLRVGITKTFMLFKVQVLRAGHHVFRLPIFVTGILNEYLLRMRMQFTSEPIKPLELWNAFWR